MHDDFLEWARETFPRNRFYDEDDFAFNMLDRELRPVEYLLSVVLGIPTHTAGGIDGLGVDGNMDVRDFLDVFERFFAWKQSKASAVAIVDGVEQ